MPHRYDESGSEASFDDEDESDEEAAPRKCLLKTSIAVPSSDVP